jgi:hypothetical protein
MTLEPTSICLRFEDVIVQKEPGRPLYSEHSLVTWSTPLREEDFENDGDAPTPVGEIVTEFDGAIGKDDPWPSQALMTIIAAIAVALSSLLRIMSIS